MPVVRSSSIGSQVTIATGDAGDPDDYTLFEQAFELTTLLGDEESIPGNGSVVSATADATAFGESTLAIVDGQVIISDTGSATTTSVSLDALAVAQSSGDVAYASTYLEAAYSGGGGPFVQIGQTYSALLIDGQDSTAVSQASLTFIAIELDDIGGDFTAALPGPSETIEPEEPPLDMAAFDGGCGCGGGASSPEIDLDGNVASFNAFVFAASENTSIDLMADAFAAEDAMSSAIIVIWAAIG